MLLLLDLERLRSNAELLLRAGMNAEDKGWESREGRGSE